MRLFLIGLNSRSRRVILFSGLLLSVTLGLAIFSGGAGDEDKEISKSAFAIGGQSEDFQKDVGTLWTIGGVALIAQNSPSGTIPIEEASRGAQVGLLSYIVKDGDTLSDIAAEYGISVNTILWENNLSKNSVLKPGMKISILPVDGVKHTVKSGDTVSGIALKYEADIETILTYNILKKDEILTIGDTIIIPEAVPVSVARSSSKSNPSIPTRSLIDASGYFVMPVQGRRTQSLHRYNAVDLGGSNFCGTPVIAAAPGTVTASRGGWNGGYGNYIKISHPNGTVTLYAHNSQNLVLVGQSVKQGEPIAYMGSTGNSTGCHVHFEVRGARNPFAS